MILNKRDIVPDDITEPREIAYYRECIEQWHKDYEAYCAEIKQYGYNPVDYDQDFYGHWSAIKARHYSDAPMWIFVCLAVALGAFAISSMWRA
jgi:hypothetical protein